jgi:hypothetical protein
MQLYDIEIEEDELSGQYVLHLYYNGRRFVNNIYTWYEGRILLWDFLDRWQYRGNCIDAPPVRMTQRFLTRVGDELLDLLDPP